VAEARVIHVAARAVLGPVLYAQARRLRRTVVALPEPTGRRAGRAGTGADRLRLLIAGDSSAAGVGARTQSEALAGQLARALAARIRGVVRWQLVARTGARSEDLLQLLQHRALHAADIGIAIVGVNDITNEVPLRHALQARAGIATAMRARAGVRHVVFPALPEMELFPSLPQPLAWYAGWHARRNNVAQAAWAGGRSDVTHAAMDGLMDPGLMAADGFHPGPRLYARVAEQLARHIADDVLPRLDQNNTNHGERS
jgi:lysophospholipase L1-like esterase